MATHSRRTVRRFVAALLGLCLSCGAAVSAADLADQLKAVPYRIVFESRPGGDWELFQVRADGSERVNLTNTPEVNELYPHVSRDGTKICFSVDEGQGPDKDRSVYRMNLDGTGRRLVAAGARDACWSAGDKGIVYLKNEFRQFTLIDYATRGVFVHDLASARNVPHPNPALEHMYSIVATPDGNWYLATVHGGMGFAHNILAIEAQGKKFFDLKIPGCRPDVSPDGRRVAWASGDYSIAVGDLDFSGPVPRVLNARDLLTSPQPWKIQHADWSPDGKYIAFSRGPYKKGLAESPALVGKLAPDWDICVADAAVPNRWTRITTDGNSNKEPDWIPSPSVP
ncbi:MAG: TolB family protein [Thermoguttaceae bacterium]